jgi:hypothetical protein
MNKIWKYILEITDQQYLQLPMGARILSVANQNESLVLYALVNPEEQTTENFVVQIFGTGNPIERLDPMSKFIGTVVMENGKLVWHVFYY